MYTVGTVASGVYVTNIIFEGVVGYVTGCDMGSRGVQKVVNKA